MEKQICYDNELNIEAYSLKGMQQEFPNHFHNYYVIGLIEKGERQLCCKNKQYTLKAGNVLLLNPKDNHGCVQVDNYLLDYVGINISSTVMRSLVKEVIGKDILPYFIQNVIYDNEINIAVKNLYKMIMDNADELEKEEMLFILISNLIERYGKLSNNIVNQTGNVQNVCDFIENNYSEKITLNQLCSISKAGKSTLLREFTKFKGVTPYRYLQSVRIEAAKKLLENGCSPVEAAMQAGFFDQSHFTRFFHMYIGLSPAEYAKIFKITEK